MALVPAKQAKSWAGLSERRRLRYSGKLTGLYRHEGDQAAYDFLPRDKQEALGLLSDRLVSLDLWQHVNRIVNVYGLGGVGMNFIANSELQTVMTARKDFTRFLARRDNTGGFFEKGRTRASLHFLYVDRPDAERDWHAHFDFYAPMGSPLSALQHLYYERFGKFRPDWLTIKSLVSETRP